MSNLKKLGIMGGMGPGSTVDFFDRIVKHTEAKSDQEHIDMVILNHTTIPDRTKVIASGNYETILLPLIADARFLEAAGVSAIAIPCNTAHFFYDQIQSSVSIPVINMIRECVDYISKTFPESRKIGIMATDGTLKTKLYEAEIAKVGKQAIIPSTKNQEILMNIIYGEIKSGQTGNVDQFNLVSKELRDNGSDVVILACTELSDFNQYTPSYCVDALDTLVKASIKAVGGKFKN